MPDFTPHSRIPLADAPPLTESAVRTRLLPPAIGVILFSALHIPAVIARYIIFSGSEPIVWTTSHGYIIFSAPTFVQSCLSVTYSIALIVGAVGIFRRGSHAWVLSTCILELIPIGGGFCFLAMPFGIWGLTVLARPGAREALRKS